MISEAMLWFKAKAEARFSEGHHKIDALLDEATKLAEEIEALKHKVILKANGSYIPHVQGNASGIVLNEVAKTTGLKEPQDASIKAHLEGKME